MQHNTLNICNDPDKGLVLYWNHSKEAALDGVPISAEISGTNLFRVWGEDSGESPPIWHEPDMKLAFLRNSWNKWNCRIDSILHEGTLCGFIVTEFDERAALTVEIRMENNEIEIGLTIKNPQGPGGKQLPLCSLELNITDLVMGDNGYFEAAMNYRGNTFNRLDISDLTEDGVEFHHGTIGLTLPLLYLYNPSQNNGIQFEVMLDGRPALGFRKGGRPNSAVFFVRWETERLLQPGETHAYGGKIRIKQFVGRTVEMMRRWRDEAESRYGIKSPYTPDWAKGMNIIEFNTDPENKVHPFQRLDDPRVYTLLQEWKEMGYTSIFIVGHNNTGNNFLSPFDYEPSVAAGGFQAEKQFLDWIHELGFRGFLWLTSVGMDKDAPEVKAHSEWWTHRSNGSLFYAWGASPPNYVSYAPDADPLSSGWRYWLKGQLQSVLNRGFDGIYLDGCIPRGSNHARWDWPGASRNSVPSQFRELSEIIKAAGNEGILFLEDECLEAQACGHVTQGRYDPVAPFLVGDYQNIMNAGGIITAYSPLRLQPEMAKDFLLSRYASLLPGAVSNDIIEGYYGEDTRPWIVQSLISGCIPKTHNHFIDNGAYLKFTLIDSMGDRSDAEKEMENRERGYMEWVGLLKFCRDEMLIRSAPMTIEGVTVEGDPAVVGMLKISKNRAILALIQFADRAASIRVKLNAPIDVPRYTCVKTLCPQDTLWEASEIKHSMVDDIRDESHAISGVHYMETAIAPYGFRLFELRAKTELPKLV